MGWRWFTQFILQAPAGSYSALLKRFCFEKSIYAFIINPRQSANFAKALDNRSKNDIIDAKMLYKFHVMLSASESSWSQFFIC